MSKLLALILLPLLYSISNAQTTLQLGTPIERELGTGQVHSFTVNLEENNFIQLVVEQRGIDVIVKVSSPSGKSLGEYDSPNGGEGPENVSFVALAAGSYQVHVEPLNPKDATTGRFQIKILEIRQATDQEVKTSKNLEVTKARGVALLAEIEETIAQIKSPQTRIKAQLQAAQLLWNIDEKRASKCLADAMTGIKEFTASVDPNEQYFEQYSTIWQLRHEIIQVLAPRDPDAALNFLHSTSQMIDPSGNQSEQVRHETALELLIAEQVSRTDPNRTLQIVRQNLKKGYSPNLMGTISELRRQKPEMAAELVNEVAAKLLNEKLLKNPEAGNFAVNLLRFYRAGNRRSQITNGAASAPNFLAEDKYRDLLQKILREALSYSLSTGQSYSPERDTVWNMLAILQSLGPQLDTFIPGGVATVEKKMAELNNSANLPSSPQYQNAIGNNSVEAALEGIGKVPPDYREQLYLQLANREANNGDLARARQILNDHVTNPYQRRQALLNLEQQEVSRAMNKGKVEEALRNLSAFRDTRERARQLAQIANQIGPGQKRATALTLLEQARSMLSLSVQAQDQDQMYALLEIARAFSRYDSKRSFEIIDPLIDQFNEICVAARTLDGFGSEYYDGEELDLQSGNSLANVAAQMSSVLGSLAVISFDRARTTTDKIRAPEVRLKAYLEIAQQTIQAGK